MKIMKVFKPLFVLFVSISMFSCENEEQSAELTNVLIGEWQRSDFSTVFEYKLLFNENNTGIRTQREGDLNSGITSSAETFNWSIESHHLTINFSNESITTHYSIDAKGYLLLNEFSQFHFVKVSP